MYTIIYNQIKSGFENDEKEISICTIYLSDDDSVISMVIKSSQWLKSLKNAIKKFEELENYELCIDIKDLINKIKDKRKSDKSKG